MNNIKMIILNSAIAGLLVFVGSASSELSDHGFTDPKGLLFGLCLGFLAAATIFLTKLQSYLTTEKKDTVTLLEFL